VGSDGWVGSGERRLGGEWRATAEWGTMSGSLDTPRHLLGYWLQCHCLSSLIFAQYNIIIAGLTCWVAYFNLRMKVATQYSSIKTVP